MSLNTVARFHTPYVFNAMTTPPPQLTWEQSQPTRLMPESDRLDQSRRFVEVLIGHHRP